MSKHFDEFLRETMEHVVIVTGLTALYIFVILAAPASE